MLTLLASQPESLWDESLPVEVKELPEDLAALDVLLADPELLWPLVERWQSEFRETGRLVLTEGRPTIRAGDVRAVDGAQAALPVGVPDAGRGGVGLDSSAQVLPDLAERAGAGRVDGPQAHPVDRCGDGVGDDTRADRGGVPREAVSTAGGADRLDRDRGGCEVSDRRGVGVERGAGAGAGGSQARQADRREEGAGAGSLAGDGSQAQDDHPHDPSSLGRGQAGGPEVDWRDRRVARALDQGSAPAGAGRAPASAWAGCEGEAESGRQRWRRWRIAARRSPPRSVSGWRASRSRIGSCRCSIRTRGRSARASSASPT